MTCKGAMRHAMHCMIQTVHACTTYKLRCHMCVTNALYIFCITFILYCTSSAPVPCTLYILLLYLLLLPCSPPLLNLLALPCALWVLLLHVALVLSAAARVGREDCVSRAFSSASVPVVASQRHWTIKTHNTCTWIAVVFNPRSSRPTLATLRCSRGTTRSAGTRS